MKSEKVKRMFRTPADCELLSNGQFVIGCDYFEAYTGEKCPELAVAVSVAEDGSYQFLSKEDMDNGY